jgi:hypothetical protein
MVVSHNGREDQHHNELMWDIIATREVAGYEMVALQATMSQAMITPGP